LAHYHSLLRYDGRGLGLSQRDVKEFSFDRAVEDPIKIVVILAAITGVALFIEEMWRLLHP